MSDFDEAVGRQLPDGPDDDGFTYRVDRKAYVELRESVENLIPGLQEQIRRDEAINAMLVANIEVTIETLTRGDEIPVMDTAKARELLHRATRYAFGETGMIAFNLYRDLSQFIDRIPDGSLPPNPNPMQSVIDRLQTVLDAAERGEIV